MADHSSTRERVIAEARSWLGTPYHHQASAKGAGCDCLGLVRGVWRAVIGDEPAVAPPYTPDWGESSGRELLMEACGAFLAPVDAPAPGDVLLFRVKPRGIAKHVGILIEGDERIGLMIHAYEGIGVIEQATGGFWARRFVGGYRFPEA